MVVEEEVTPKEEATDLPEAGMAHHEGACEVRHRLAGTEMGMAEACALLLVQVLLPCLVLDPWVVEHPRQDTTMTTTLKECRLGEKCLHTAREAFHLLRLYSLPSGKLSKWIQDTAHHPSTTRTTV